MKNRGKTLFLDIVQTVTAVLLITMLVLVLVQVAARFIFKSPVAQTDELSRYAMVWSALLGASIATRKKSHVAVTILVDKLPARLQTLARYLVHLAMAVFFILLTWQGIKLIGVSMTQNSSTLPIKMGHVMLILPITGILNLVFIAMNAYDDLMERRKPQ